MPCAAPLERRKRIAKEGLQEGKDGVWTHAQRIIGPARRKDRNTGDAHLGQEVAGLILDHIGQRAHQHQLPGIGCGQGRDHRGKAGILALGKGGFDS